MRLVTSTFVLFIVTTYALKESSVNSESSDVKKYAEVDSGEDSSSREYTRKHRERKPLRNKLAKNKHEDKVNTTLAKISNGSNDTEHPQNDAGELKNSLKQENVNKTVSKSRESQTTVRPTQKAKAMAKAEGTTTAGGLRAVPPPEDRIVWGVVEEGNTTTLVQNKDKETGVKDMDGDIIGGDDNVVNKTTEVNGTDLANRNGFKTECPAGEVRIRTGQCVKEV